MGSYNSGQDEEAVLQWPVEEGWEFGDCFYKQLRNPLTSSHIDEDPILLEIELFMFQFT